MFNTDSVSTEMTPKTSRLDFVWLELTNRCNLQCSHCYTESSPTSGGRDSLNECDYLAIISQLQRVGCRQIQFIGGEPTLNRSFPNLIEAAADAGFTFIEVFSNLVRLPDELLESFCRFGVSVATSFYSHKPFTHDAITGQVGSFDRTVRNIRRVIGAGLSLRAGLIVMDQNKMDVVQTWTFLQELGIDKIGIDSVRKFGRADHESTCEMSELCGSCAGNVLSIAPDGRVSPCNMSRFWSVGSLADTPLEEILLSPQLNRLRKEIAVQTEDNERNSIHAICTPKTCSPYSACCPTTQACLPCAPNNCNPCRPRG